MAQARLALPYVVAHRETLEGSSVKRGGARGCATVHYAPGGRTRLGSERSGRRATTNAHLIPVDLTNGARQRPREIGLFQYGNTRFDPGRFGIPGGQNNGKARPLSSRLLDQLRSRHARHGLIG